jgi:hypothetical protein
VVKHAWSEIAGIIASFDKMRISGADAESYRPAAAAADRQSSVAVRALQIVSDLAGTIDHIGRSARGEQLARDAATLILDSVRRAENGNQLNTFALGIPFGTGLTLPLLLADELERRGDQRRKRQLWVAIQQGLRRLQDRIHRTVMELIELTLPVAALVTAGTEVEARGCEQITMAASEYVKRNIEILGRFALAVRWVETGGHDVFLALDALSRRDAMAVELQCVRTEFVTSSKVAFAISQSRSALVTVQHRAAPSGLEPVPRLAPHAKARAQQVYESLGFSKPRSALLASAVAYWQSTVLMDAGWAAEDRACHPDDRREAFEELLKFIGAAEIPRAIQGIQLSDGDEGRELHAPHGLTLFRALEQVA